MRKDHQASRAEKKEKVRLRNEELRQWQDSQEIKLVLHKVAPDLGELQTFLTARSKTPEGGYVFEFNPFKPEAVAGVILPAARWEDLRTNAAASRELSATFRKDHVLVKELDGPKLQYQGRTGTRGFRYGICGCRPSRNWTWLMQRRTRAVSSVKLRP